MHPRRDWKKRFLSGVLALLLALNNYPSVLHAEDGPPAIPTNGQGIPTPVVSADEFEKKLGEQAQVGPFDYNEQVYNENTLPLNAPEVQESLSEFNPLTDSQDLYDDLRNFAADKMNHVPISRENLAAVKEELELQMATVFDALEKVPEWLEDEISKVNEKYTKMSEEFDKLIEAAYVDDQVIVSSETATDINKFYDDVTKSADDANHRFVTAYRYMRYGPLQSSLDYGEYLLTAMGQAEQAFQDDPDLDEVTLDLSPGEDAQDLPVDPEMAPVLDELYDRVLNLLGTVQAERALYLNNLSYQAEVIRGSQQAGADLTRLQEIFEEHLNTVLENPAAAAALTESIANFKAQIETYLQEDYVRAVTEADSEGIISKLEELSDPRFLPAGFHETLDAISDYPDLDPVELYNAYADWINAILQRDQDGLLMGPFEDDESLQAAWDYWNDFARTLSDYHDVFEDYNQFEISEADVKAASDQFAAYADSIQDTLETSIEKFYDKLNDLLQESAQAKAQLNADEDASLEIKALLKEATFSDDDDNQYTYIEALTDSSNYYSQAENAFQDIPVNQIPSNLKAEYESLRAEVEPFSQNLISLTNHFEETIDLALEETEDWLSGVAAVRSSIQDYEDIVTNALTADDIKNGDIPELPARIPPVAFPNTELDRILNSIVGLGQKIGTFLEKLQEVASVKNAIHEALPKLPGIENFLVEKQELPEDLSAFDIPENILPDGIFSVTTPESSEPFLLFISGTDESGKAVIFPANTDTEKVLGASIETAPANDEEKLVAGQSQEIPVAENAEVIILDAPDSGTLTIQDGNIIYESAEDTVPEEENSVTVHIQYATQTENEDGTYALEIHDQEVTVYKDQETLDVSNREIEFNTEAVGEHIADVESLGLTDGQAVTGGDVQTALEWLQDSQPEIVSEENALVKEVNASQAAISEKTAALSGQLDQVLAAVVDQNGDVLILPETSEKLDALIEKIQDLIQTAGNYPSDYYEALSAQYDYLTELRKVYGDALTAAAEELAGHPGQESAVLNLGDMPEAPGELILPENPEAAFQEISAEISDMLNQIEADKRFIADGNKLKNDTIAIYNDMVTEFEALQQTLEDWTSDVQTLLDHYQEKISSLGSKEDLKNYLLELSEAVSLSTAERELASAKAAELNDLDAVDNTIVSDYLKEIEDLFLEAPRKTLEAISAWLDQAADLINENLLTQEAFDAAKDKLDALKGEAVALKEENAGYAENPSPPEGPYENEAETMNSIRESADELAAAATAFENKIESLQTSAEAQVTAIETAVNQAGELKNQLEAELSGGSAGEDTKLEALQSAGEALQAELTEVQASLDTLPNEFEKTLNERIAEVQALIEQLPSMSAEARQSVVDALGELSAWLPDAANDIEDLQAYINDLNQETGDTPDNELPAQPETKEIPEFPQEQIEQIISELQDAAGSLRETASMASQIVEPIRDNLKTNYNYDLPESADLDYNPDTNEVTVPVGNKQVVFQITENSDGALQLAPKSGFEEAFPPSDENASGGTPPEPEFNPEKIKDTIDQVMSLDLNDKPVTAEEVTQYLDDLYGILNELANEQEAYPEFIAAQGTAINEKINQLDAAFQKLLSSAQTPEGEPLVDDATVQAINALWQAGTDAVDAGLPYAENLQDYLDEKYQYASDLVLANIEALENADKLFKADPDLDSTTLDVNTPGENSDLTLPENPMPKLEEVAGTLADLQQRVDAQIAFNKAVKEFREKVIDQYNTGVADLTKLHDEIIPGRETEAAEKGAVYAGSLQALPENLTSIRISLLELLEDRALTASQRNLIAQKAGEILDLDTSYDPEILDEFTGSLAEIFTENLNETMSLYMTWQDDINKDLDSFDFQPANAEALAQSQAAWAPFEARFNELHAKTQTSESEDPVMPEGPYDSLLNKYEEYQNFLAGIQDSVQTFYNNIEGKTQTAQADLLTLDNELEASRELLNRLNQEKTQAPGSKADQLASAMAEYQSSQGELSQIPEENVPPELRSQWEQLQAEMELYAQGFDEAEQRVQDEAEASREAIEAWIEGAQAQKQAILDYLETLKAVDAEDIAGLTYPGIVDAPQDSPDVAADLAEINRRTQEMKDFPNKFILVELIRNYLQSKHGFDLPAESAVTLHDDNTVSVQFGAIEIVFKEVFSTDPQSGEQKTEVEVVSGTQVDQIAAKDYVNQMIKTSFPKLDARATFSFSFSSLSGHLSEINLPSGVFPVGRMTASIDEQDVFNFFTGRDVATGELRVFADNDSDVFFRGGESVVSDSKKVVDGESIEIATDTGAEVITVIPAELGYFFPGDNVVTYYALGSAFPEGSNTPPGATKDDYVTWFEKTGGKILIHDSKFTIYQTQEDLDAVQEPSAEDLAERNSNIQSFLDRGSGSRSLGGGGSMAGTDSPAKPNLGLGERPLEKDAVARKLRGMFKDWASNEYEQNKADKTQELEEGRQKLQREIFKS